jgi:hypothetical protein
VRTVCLPLRSRRLGRLNIQKLLMVGKATGLTKDQRERLKPPSPLLTAGPELLANH